MTDLLDTLIGFGGDPEGVRFLDQAGPELLPYATLLTARRNGNEMLEMVSAVYEWQGNPLIFLVDADSLQEDGQLRKIRRLLAMRGDAPYLGVVAPGRLDVYRIALDDAQLAGARVEWTGEAHERAATMAWLGNTRPRAATSQRDWISNILLKLLTASIDNLIDVGKISDEDAISLAGRALFTRFLADRELLPAEMFSDNTGASLFDNREAAEKTSLWLDAKFNGDLLPLSADIFRTLPDAVYHALGNVLRRAPDSQLLLGWEEKWANLDFAHIPVGVLSQAYELYLRKHAQNRQQKEGGYYTPQPIANLMVRASFSALERRGRPHQAKVLDPAAGAGVFLLTAFRELVAQRWRADQKRPDTIVLRSILYDQIVGFDVNESALRFAALGLYLISIELDPEPLPIDKLRFRNLRGTVLHLVQSEHQAEGRELGSLGPLVGTQHVGRYDLVIGNPPWSSGTKLADWDLVLTTVARIATERRSTPEFPPLPNESLDLPFVWRAMEWAKADGQIAFALHARLLFQQGDGMAQARQDIFEAVDVTSVINGADLRRTKVWPGVSAPFCILLATNRMPEATSAFRLISPRLESSLTGAGSMRVDASNAELIPVGQLRDTPEILKILFRGTRMDLGLVERIRAQGHPTLEEFWQDEIGLTKRLRLRGSGTGYQKVRPSSRERKPRKGEPDHGQFGVGADATYLKDFPEITAETFTALAIDHQRLPLFSQERIHDRRSEEMFTGPLVVVHKSPSVASGRIGVAISEVNAVYNETFYGYSPHGYSGAHDFVRYLTLILGSKVAIWFALMTSGEFGFEREVVEKATLDRMPLPDFRTFSPMIRQEISNRYSQLLSGEITWTDIDTWVASLYGLGLRDVQVISDTLEFNLPYADRQREAQTVPTRQEQVRFCKVLEQELTPWCDRFGSQILVRPVDQSSVSPWYGIDIRTSVEASSADVHPSDWQGLLRAADDLAASELVLENAQNHLLVGRLAQRRYWSETQARLLAQRIVWSHVDTLRGTIHA